MDAPAVLRALAALYEQSAAGRHGGGKLDLQPGYEDLLARAGCAEGNRRELAERELQRAHDAGMIELVPVHRRDPRHYSKVRFPSANEQALFDFIGETSPTQRRMEWAELFREAQTWSVPEKFRPAWAAYCEVRSAAALVWRGMQPYSRDQIEIGSEWLRIAAQLLGWEGRSLIRWVSSVVCGDSKLLERRQRTLEQILCDATGGAVYTLQELGIEPVPAEVSFHGPIRLCMCGEWQDFGTLTGPSRLSGVDVERIDSIECSSVRCLCVENRTPFLSLAGTRSGELLVHTSYPNKATANFLRKLQGSTPQMEFWHFGDTDPAGFHILADLRKQTGIAFRAFYMNYRPNRAGRPLLPREVELVRELMARMPDERCALEAMLDAGCKGDFEQESLRPPVLANWPFYNL